MNVAELVASLGLSVDFNTIARATSAMNRLRTETEQATNAAKLSSALNHTFGDTAKALSVVSLGELPGKGAAPGGAAASGPSRWGRALEVANAGLGVALKGYTILSSAVGRVQGAFDATAAAAARYNDTSTKLGIGVETVQELGFAASQSSSNLGELSAGLTGLANKVDAAKKGSKDATASLRAVGLSAREIRSGAVTLDGAFGKIADRFTKMPDGARKSALAFDLFGANGTKLIPLLNKGSGGIAELRDRARELGIVMSGDTTSAVAGLADEQAVLRDQLGGIRDRAIAAIVPMLSKLVKSMQEWVAANRQLLISALTGALKGLVYVLRAVGAVLTGVVAIVAYFSEHANLAIALLGGLAAAFLAFGIVAAASWLAALWPFVLFAAAVAALIILWPKIRRAAAVAASAIGDAFRSMWRGLMDGGSAVLDWFHRVFSAVGDFFAAIGAGIRDSFYALVNFLIDRLNNVIELANKAIDGLNHVPGVDISHISTIGAVGGSASVPAPASKTASTVTNNMNIAVNAPNADAAQVSQQVADHVASYWDAQMRAAGEGIA